ncbi:hypothetical protein HI914_05764 [Erysiphe necator]|uniref:Putative pre-mrna-processing factor 31 n=1 Tax=Uncinula necator TaxID=52586 RepID=A0A0B1PBT1_UNCNE|nr:hypothetical protein HI914_05764 [Erysiphe necator]KHJ34396.1 putative pre-mrna-processing factor 31 [Erysiphe necator]
MSTLADQLLQDFEDSDPEDEDNRQAQESLSKDGVSSDSNGIIFHDVSRESMELDDDEEADDDEDQVMSGVETSSLNVQDEDNMKANVEKMELGAVDDVRSVARKMKKIEPVLEKVYISISVY